MHPRRDTLKKILIVQTAFIGDVILATSMVEQIVKELGENVQIDFLLRNGNESILADNPHVRNVLIWNKKEGKFKNLIKLILEVRRSRYDLLINIQRFFSSGLLTALSGAEYTVGFDKNPLSSFFDHEVAHHIPHYGKDGVWHEVQRNQNLLNWALENKEMPESSELKPKLYFNIQEEQKLIKVTTNNPDYVVIAPASVWFTKAFPVERWKELVSKLSKSFHVYAVGAPSDKSLVDSVISESTNCTNLCGVLKLKESALLMKKAKQVYVNDSGPLHLASSVDAPTTAFFCSTITDYGYFPLSTNSRVLEVSERLECRPCGLHGKKECPKGHFDCGHKINLDQAVEIS